jgi:hypothetical protein
MNRGTLSLVRDDIDPRRSTNTTLIGAALAAGADFASSKALHDSIDEEGKRQVTWSMNGDRLMRFSPDFDEEEIEFAEFRRRFESSEWCEENPDHPIAFLRAYRDQMNRLRDKLRTMKPMARVKKGRRVALIPADTPAAKRQEILGEL